MSGVFLPTRTRFRTPSPERTRVSIAIRAYRRQWLGDAIASVLAQTYADLELVVYDDAGDLEPFVRGFDDPRVRYERAERRLGASGRFRAAVALCRGSYIGVLDDDDFYQPEFVERLVAALDQDPGAGVAFCPGVWEVDGERYVARNGLAPGRQEDATFDIVAGRLRVPPSRMLLRREALEDAERWQSMPDAVAPDVYVNVHTALTGWHHVLVDDVLAVCRWHPDQMTRAGRDAYELAVRTQRTLRLDDPGLEVARRKALAGVLVDQAVYELESGDRRAARAALHEAAREDPAVAAWLRRALGIVAAVPGAGPAVRAAYRVRCRLRRRPALPPDVAGSWTGGRQVARDAASFAVWSVAAQALTVLAAPVLTRLYGPAAIGAASVLTSLMAFFALVACLRFDVAIPLARDGRATAELCALCALCTAGLTAVLTAVAVVFGQQLSDAAGVPGVGPYLWLVPLYVALAGAGLIGAGLLIRSRDYGGLGRTRTTHAVGQTATQLAAGAAGGGAPWFAAGVAAGAAGYAIAAARCAGVRSRAVAASAGRALRGAGGAVRTWRGFAGWSSSASVLQGAGLAIPAVMIAGWYGPAAAGLFAVTQRVLGLPVALMGEAVGSAWYGTAAEIVRERRGGLHASFVAVTWTLVLAGGAVLAIVVVAAPPLFGTVFGDGWHGGGDLVLALAPLHFSLFAAVPAGQALQACGRTGLLTIVAAGRLGAPIAGIAGGHALGWSLTESMALYAAAMAAVSALNATLAWRVTRRTAGGS